MKTTKNIYSKKTRVKKNLIKEKTLTKIFNKKIEKKLKNLKFGFILFNTFSFYFC